MCARERHCTGHAEDRRSTATLGRVARIGDGGMQALANAKLPPDMRLWLSDPEGDKAYPITSYTWMMFYKKYDDPNKAAAIRKMIDYCLTEGQKMSDKMGYLPLPQNVIAEVRKATANIN